MSSKSESVIRCTPEAGLYRPPWPTRQATDEHALGSIFYHQALGVVVARFNSLELSFRGLVGASAQINEPARHAVLTHVGSGTLSEALKTIANDVVESELVEDELLFAVSLFEVNRANRNFLVHSATEKHDFYFADGKDGMLMTRRTARGKLRTDHYLLAVDAFRKTADEILDCREYFGRIIGPCSHYKPGIPLTLPHRPALPKYLADTHPKGALFEILHGRSPDEDNRDQ